jgi:hypothetical protein
MPHGVVGCVCVWGGIPAGKSLIDQITAARDAAAAAGNDGDPPDAVPATGRSGSGETAEPAPTPAPRETRGGEAWLEAAEGGPEPSGRRPARARRRKENVSRQDHLKVEAAEVGAVVGSR